MYVNDLPEGMDSCHHMFACDEKVLRGVKSEEDCIILLVNIIRQTPDRVDEIQPELM